MCVCVCVGGGLEPHENGFKNDRERRETEGRSERVRGIGPRLDGILEIYEADDECLK